LDPSSIQDFSTILGFSDLFCNLSIIIYTNVETDKSRILSDNKGLSGVYMWKHEESGKIYIGSAVDLSKRFSLYFSKSYLEKNKSYINNAILLHGYSLFSLTILEYIETSNLSKEEARKLILKLEQQNLDLLKPEYNILKIAGSSLGRKHSAGTKAKLSELMKGENHPMFGKTHSPETLAKISEVNKGKGNPFYGKIHSLEARSKMSKANSGENHPLFGVTGENHPMFGKTHSAGTKAKMSEVKKGILKTEEHKAKISKAMYKKVYVYSSATPTILSYEFISISEAAKHFNCNIMTISKYIKSKKLFQNQWILSLYKE